MSHMRSEDEDRISASVDELLQQGRDGGAAVHISHIKVVYGHGRERAEVLLARLEEARSEGLVITADLYPYEASYTGISIVFPGGALPPNDYEEVLRTGRDELAEFLRRKVAARNGPEATLFGTGPWTGRTLAEAVWDRATFEEPHLPAAGFETVIVNGVPVLLEGRPTGARPGRILRSP